MASRVRSACVCAILAAELAALAGVAHQAQALSCDPPNTRTSTDYGFSCSPEFKVNEIPIGDQWLPAIAPAPNGGFTATWASRAHQSDGWHYGVFARRFDALGAGLTPDLAVSATTAADKRWPAIAADPGGGFTVAWASYEQDGSGWGIYARRFDSAGAPLTGEIQVNVTTAGHQWLPAVATDSGGFTIAWTSDGQDGSGYGVYARRFNAAGVAVGGEIPVNVATFGDQWEPVIASDAGGFMIAWTGQDASSDGIFARRFDAAGAPLTGEIPINTTTELEQWGPAIARTGTGFDIAWTSNGQDETPGLDPGYGVYARRFSSAGAPLSDEIPVAAAGGDQWSPAIAADPGGGFTVAYVAGDGIESDGISARRFDAQGNTLTGVAVNVFTASEQLRPAIVADGSGGFTVAWMSWGEDWQYADWGIFARRFAVAADAWIESWPWTPSGVTNDNTLTFTFRSHDAEATFECQLDGGGFSPCASPHTTEPLEDGTHKFEVRALNADGQPDPWPDSRSVKVDQTPPDTFIDSGPEGLTNDRTPTFGFHSSELGYGFECRINDGENAGEFRLCASLWTTSLLGDGSHTFEVRAIDAAGNTDPTPATDSFTVDSTPPQISIESGPAGPTNDPTPTFAFSLSGDVLKWTCELDGGVFPDCSSPFFAGALADGLHVFALRATDLANNETVDTRAFTVDTVPPDTSIKSGPSGVVNNPTPTFILSSNEANVVFECRVDDGDRVPCGSIWTTSPLADGPHAVEVWARDAAGNTDATPAARSFAVDTFAPDTVVGSGPSGLINKAAATFTFSSNEAGSRFECRLDASGFSACRSPFSTSALADGRHTFEVRAGDAVANFDPTPASRSFRIDTRPPATTILRGKTESIGRRIVVVVEVGCDEESAVRAGGSVLVSGLVHWIAGAGIRRRRTTSFALTEVSEQLNADESAALRLSPKTGRARRHLARLMMRGRTARAKISLWFTDRAGNSTTAALTIRLR